MITALISVFDKTGLVEFLSMLKKFHELRIIATTSTLDYLKQHNFECTGVEDLTKFPEILGGRVKTLHPKIFGGILARSGPEDEDTLAHCAIGKIDMVIVNLYPFEEKLKEGLNESKMVEYIDIGGVSLLRAAAKNFKRVTVICKAEQYKKVEQSLTMAKGDLSEDLNHLLAQETFERTAAYDRTIASYLAIDNSVRDLQHKESLALKDMAQGHLPSSLQLTLNQYQPLRYGENPHQAAIWYAGSAVNGCTDSG